MPRATQAVLRSKQQLFQDIAAAERLKDITNRLPEIWQTYDFFHGDGLALSMAEMRRQGPAVTMAMCRAASRCLTLLHQQRNEDDGAFVMPSKAATVTCIRMMLHMLARFVSDWVFHQNDERAIAQDSSKVAEALQDTGELNGCN